MQMKTPKGMLVHVGFLAGQSKQVLLSCCASSFLNTLCVSLMSNDLPPMAAITACLEIGRAHV